MNSIPYIKLKCNLCKEEVYLQLYFEAPLIFDETRPESLVHHYKAQVRGRGTCYNCGCQISELFEKNLSSTEIINLAIKFRRAESHYVVNADEES